MYSTTQHYLHCSALVPHLLGLISVTLEREKGKEMLKHIFGKLLLECTTFNLGFDVTNFSLVAGIKLTKIIFISVKYI